MTGSILNAAGIVLGGLAGLAVKKPLSAATQHYFKNGLGAFCLFLGLRLAWLNVNGPAKQAGKELLLVLLTLLLGRWLGRLLRLQHLSNRLGRGARDAIAAAGRQPPRWSDGFNTCTALYCAAPLAFLGPVAEGLAGDVSPLAIKAVMDGLATWSFVRLFGWSAPAAALPVFAWQSTLTLLCAGVARPFLEGHQLAGPVEVTAGFLILCVALLILEVRKIEVTDYLPALALAPLFSWWWR
jgi:uncharacterized protein